MSQANVTIIQRLYDAVAQRDADAVMALYDSDVEIDLTHGTAWGDVTGQEIFRGHEGLRAMFKPWHEAWDRLEDELEEVIDAGDHVITVATSRGRGRISGVEVELSHYAGVWTVRDGKITHVVWFTSRVDALEAAGLSE